MWQSKFDPVIPSRDDSNPCMLTWQLCSVIMASGLMALVDNCIKERWQTKKIHRIPVPLTSKTVDVAPLAFMHQVFGRRNSNDQHYQSNPTSALRHQYPISAY
jgi:hypothetical protein